MDDLDRNNPNLWKWGIFYYNPKAPEALSSREGGGIRTGPALNFAHKRTYLYLFLVIVGIVIVWYLKGIL